MRSPSGSGYCQPAGGMAGDKLLAARSNEFGFANYEIIPQPHALDPLGPAPLLEPKPAAKPPARGSKS